MPSRVTVKTVKPANQAKILLEENHSTPIVAFCAYFKGGVRNEEEERSGLTYFTQKLLQKGTKKFSAEELAFRMEALGGKINLVTEKDAFGGHFSVLSKHFDEALDLFAQIFFHPVFHPEEVEKEREFLCAEIQERSENLYSYCLELCDRALFPRHPYRLPVKGEMESIRSIKRDDLAAWHQQWYRPNNLVFSIVGDIAADRAGEKVAEALQNLPKGKISKNKADVGERNLAREISVESEKRQLLLALGFHAPSAADEERFAFEVVNGVLTGMGSRLFIELRDKKGLAYSVSSRYDPHFGQGVIKASMGTTPERETVAKEGLLEEFLKLREVPVAPDELARAKQNLIGLHEIRAQKNALRALRYARYELFGLKWRTSNQYPKKIEAVSAEMVQDLAKRYFNSDQYAYAVIRPRSGSPASSSVSA